MLFLTLIVSALSAAVAASSSIPTTNSFTSASFNSTPEKVLNVANTTAGCTDSAWTSYSWGAIGPGFANSTLYLWGYSYTSGASTISIIQRKLSATIIAYGNDTIEASTVSGSIDYFQTAELTATFLLKQSPPVTAVAPSCLAIGTVQGPTSSPSSNDYLVLCSCKHSS